MKLDIIKKTVVIVLIYSSIVLAVGWRNEVEIKDPDCEYVFDPKISSNSTTIHIIVRSFGDQTYRCFQPGYGKSTDTGENWNVGPLMEFDNECGAPFSVNIVVSDNNIFCIGENTTEINLSIVYGKSIDNGVSWETGDISTGCKKTQPAIAVNNYIHAIWTDWREGNLNPEIYYSKCPIEGDNWSEQELVSARDTTWLPDITANNNYIHVVWADNRNTGNFEIYYKRCDHGIWGNNVRLTNIAGSSSFPATALYGNNVYLVWQDDRTDNPGVYYKKSTDNGTSWQSEINIAPTGKHPDIAVDANGIYVVYDKDNEIYYRQYIVSWESPVQITDNFEVDSFPEISTNIMGRHVIYRRGAWLGGRVWFKQLDTYCPPATNLHTGPGGPPPVALVWDASIEPANYIDGYDVYRRLLPSGSFSWLAFTTINAYNDGNVNYGSTYEYYVKAKDTFGNVSDASNTIQVYVPDPGPKDKKPVKD